jgi:hypothetical protein
LYFRNELHITTVTAENKKVQPENRLTGTNASAPLGEGNLCIRRRLFRL